MKSFRSGKTAIRRPSVIVGGMLLFLLLAAPARSAAADAITPVEDFSRELDKLKNSFDDLGKNLGSFRKFAVVRHAIGGRTQLAKWQTQSVD